MVGTPPALAIAATVRSMSIAVVSSSETKRSTPHTAVRSASGLISSGSIFSGLRSGTQIGPGPGDASGAGTLLRWRYHHQRNAPLSSDSNARANAAHSESANEGEATVIFSGTQVQNSWAGSEGRAAWAEGGDSTGVGLLTSGGGCTIGCEGGKNRR